MATKLTGQQIVDLARRYRGVSESPPNSNRVMFSEWFGFIGPWCAMFVSYILTHGGYPFKMAYVPAIKDWAIREGRWFTDRRKAKPGDLVIYWFTNRPDHVGIFAKLLPDGRVDDIEGNTGSNNRDGGSVQERYRNAGIHGFVRMDYVTTPEPTPHNPPVPQVRMSEMLFFFNYPEAKRTFMSDGFHYREVSDSDKAVFSVVFKSQTGKEIGHVNLTEEQVNRMVKVGP